MKQEEKLWMKGDLCEIWSRSRKEGLPGIILEGNDELYHLTKIATCDGVFTIAASFIYEIGESKDDFCFPNFTRVDPALYVIKIIKIEALPMPKSKIFLEHDILN